MSGLRQTLSTKASEYKEKWLRRGILFWAGFLIGIYFIVNGAMLIYECQTTTSADTDQNVGLIVVGAITIALAGILMIVTMYVLRYFGSACNWWHLAVIIFAIVFGVALGTLSVINGVDVPNAESRKTIGWVLGGIGTAGAVVLTFVSMVMLFKKYWGEQPTNERFEEMYLESEMDLSKQEAQTNAITEPEQSTPSPPQIKPRGPTPATRASALTRGELERRLMDVEAQNRALREGELSG